MSEDSRNIVRHYKAGHNLGSDVPTLNGWHPWWGTRTIFQYAVAVSLFLLMLISYYGIPLHFFRLPGWGKLVNSVIPSPHNLILTILLFIVVPFVGGALAGFANFDGQSATFGLISRIMLKFSPRLGHNQDGAIKPEPHIVLRPWATLHTSEDQT